MCARNLFLIYNTDSTTLKVFEITEIRKKYYHLRFKSINLKVSTYNREAAANKPTKHKIYTQLATINPTTRLKICQELWHFKVKIKDESVFTFNCKSEKKITT